MTPLLALLERRLGPRVAPVALSIIYAIVIVTCCALLGTLPGEAIPYVDIR